MPGNENTQCVCFVVYLPTKSQTRKRWSNITHHLRKKWNIADDNGLSFLKNSTYLRASKWIFWAAFLKLAWDSSICAKADFAFLCKPRIVVLFIHRKKKRFFSLITNATNLRTIIGLHGQSHSFSCTCLLAMFGLW